MYDLADVELFINCVTFSSGLPRRHLQVAALCEVWQCVRNVAMRV